MAGRVPIDGLDPTSTNQVEMGLELWSTIATKESEYLTLSVDLHRASIGRGEPGLDAARQQFCALVKV